MTDKFAHRAIKSFVLRAGRVSPRQQLGLDVCLPKYQLKLTDDMWDFNSLFGRVSDVVIEIGFGMGQSLLTMAQQQPQVDFIGIEVHQAGLGSLAADLQDHAVENVRLAPYDATEVLKRQIPNQSLAGAHIFFPDPWPKLRHHKRRLIQPDFVQLLVEKIKIGGIIHLATDWEAYAMQMRDVLLDNPYLVSESGDTGFVDKPASRPTTKFERRGILLGHKVWDLKFIRKASTGD